MPSQIDFAIAAGLFIVFTAAIIMILLNYLSNYFNISTVSDLRTVAYDTFYAVFSGMGIPSNWETTSYSPVKLGLVANLYEVPFFINETNGTARTNETVNATFFFDSSCLNRAWNTTVRVYDSDGNAVPSVLYNSSFCSSQYLLRADVVFNVTVSANSQAKFFLFYSPEKKIIPNPASYSYPSAGNYTSIIYPEITLQTVSVDKLLSLRNLSYDQVAQTLSTNFKFYFEVGK